MSSDFLPFITGFFVSSSALFRKMDLALFTGDLGPIDDQSRIILGIIACIGLFGIFRPRYYGISITTILLTIWILSLFRGFHHCAYQREIDVDTIQRCNGPPLEPELLGLCVRAQLRLTSPKWHCIMYTIEDQVLTISKWMSPTYGILCLGGLLVWTYKEYLVNRPFMKI